MWPSPQGLRMAWLLAVIAGMPAQVAGKPLAASFLGSRTVAPTVCVDTPGWQDSRGFQCKDYNAQAFCDSKGNPGLGWVPLWGTLSDYAGVQNQGADAACCSCGGGIQQDLPTCSSFQCPTGFTAKSAAANQHCMSLTCDGQKDMLTCCDEGLEVANAVDKINVLHKELLSELAHSTKKAGEAEADKVYTEAKTYTDKQLEELKLYLDKERAAATSEAKSWFTGLTGSAPGVNLEQAVQHEITSVGYMAAKVAATKGGARMNEEALKDSAKGVQDAYQHALSSWQSATDVGGSASKMGLQEFEDYYKDLNSTWPQIVQGIKAANDALDATTGPGQATRWGKESTRLTTDLTQLVNLHATSVNAQVQAAKGSADLALENTSGNRRKVVVLEAMVEQSAKAMQ